VSGNLYLQRGEPPQKKKKSEEREEKRESVHYSRTRQQKARGKIGQLNDPARVRDGVREFD